MSLIQCSIIQGLVVIVSPKPEILEISCSEVQKVLSDYLDDDITDEMRRRIEDHLQGCKHCTAICDGLRNVVQLLGDDRVIELPTGFSRRLYRRLLQ